MINLAVAQTEAMQARQQAACRGAEVSYRGYIKVKRVAPVATNHTSSPIKFPISLAMFQFSCMRNYASMQNI